MEKTQNKAIDILKKAYEKDTVEVNFDLGGGVIANLSLADAADMFAEQGCIKEDKQYEYEKKGYGDRPIDEKKWETYLKSVKPEHRERIAKDRPCNRAEQRADEDTQRIIIRDLLAKYLRDENGAFHFPDEQSQQKFGRMAISTPRLTKLITDKLIELTGKVSEIQETVKNS